MKTGNGHATPDGRKPAPPSRRLGTTIGRRGMSALFYLNIAFIAALHLGFIARGPRWEMPRWFPAAAVVSFALLWAAAFLGLARKSFYPRQAHEAPIASPREVAPPLWDRDFDS